MPLPLDIHGGGQDLIFPHHENEIAQTEAALDKPFVRYWMHNGFVQVDAEKMSKSLGNFKTIRDILEGYLPEVLRFFLLTKHYRSPIDFTFDSMDEAEKSLKRIYEALSLARTERSRSKWSATPLPADVTAEFDTLDRAFDEALEDDLNTAAALGHVFGTIRLVNRLLEDKNLRKSAETLALLERLDGLVAKWMKVLGVFGREPEAFLSDLKECRIRRKGIDTTKVDALLEERKSVRAAKDFARADAIRDELAALGIEVRDTPSGAVWDVL